MRRPPNPRTMRRPSDPNPFSIADPKEAPRDNLYNKARRAENAKRAASGKQPLQSQLKQLAKLGRAVGYASKAIPVAGTVASAYDVAQQLGGPPTKDPKKFKNYKRLVRRGYRAK